MLTGGELAALVMTDAVARLRPGVLGQEASLAAESHTIEGVLEYPQYTRPEVYRVGTGKQKSKIKNQKYMAEWRVPEVLLSGHHKCIEEWRKKMMI